MIVDSRDLSEGAGEDTAEIEEVAPEPKPCYFIDLSWFDEVGRSFAALAQGRMCESCRQRLGTEEEVSEPAIDKKTGRVVFEKRMVPFGSNPFVVIRDCCAKARRYIHPDLPLLEIIFRIFLADANQPLDADQLHERLVEWLGGAISYRDISPAKLQRILDGDRFYGLRRLELPQTVEETGT